MNQPALKKQQTSIESNVPLLEKAPSASSTSTSTIGRTPQLCQTTMEPHSVSEPYNLLHSPLDSQRVHSKIPVFLDKTVSFDQYVKDTRSAGTRQISKRDNLEYTMSVESDNFLYDHDVVLVFSRKSGGEEQHPEAYSMQAFVNLMLGIDEEKSKREGVPVFDAFHRVLKSKRCFMEENDTEKSMSVRTVSSHSGVPAREMQSRINHLKKEYYDFVGSMNATTQTNFSELVARGIAKRIQLACGLTTRMFLSCDGDEIIMTIKADDNDLRTEADRTNYRLQVSNKPFDTVIHGEKLERVKAEMSKESWMDSIQHLDTIRGAVVDDNPETVEMDPLLISSGRKYHPNLYAALSGWGHTEEADGPCAFLKQGELFAKKLEEMKAKANYPCLQKSILMLSEYDPLTYFAPYVAYKCEAIYQPYYRRYPIRWNGTKEETLFPQKDRIRLTSSIMNRHIDLDALRVSGYLECMFALHDAEAMQDLRNAWALHWTMIAQPLNKIRFYFGEKIAIYFAWLGFYTRFLIIPSIAGLITEIVAYQDRAALTRYATSKDKPSPSTFILIAFAVFVVIWGILVPEIWKRKNALYNGSWGFYNYNIHTKYRPQFRGVKSYNPRDDTEEMTFPSKLRRRRALMVSVIVVLTMIAIVIVALIFLFLLKFWINGGRIFGMTVPISYRQPLTYVVTGINAVQILVFNTIYRGVAVRLNDWENHRTDIGYENNLIWKVFLFQFSNSFASFFYIAFFKEGIEGQCINSNCLQELRDQLLILFLIRIIVGNALEVIVPFLKYRYALYQEKSAFSSEMENGSKTGHNIIEKQAKLIPYGHDEAFEDYNELIIQFGFLTLFVVAFPLTPLLAFANNIAEVHVDAIKLCYVHRRPYPHAAKDMGAWFYILRIMVIIAIGTNAALILYTADDIFDFNISDTTRVGVYLAVYQIGLFMALAITRLFPESRELKQLMSRHEYIEACVFKGMNMDIDCNLCETAEKLDLTIYPNNQWKEGSTEKTS